MVIAKYLREKTKRITDVLCTVIIQLKINYYNSKGNLIIIIHFYLPTVMLQFSNNIV